MRTISNDKADGYRGIWFELGQKENELGDKYSGGLGTYTAKHVPTALYAPSVNKTFFVYGGTPQDKERHLLAMASFFDHKRGVVPKPTIVHDKGDVDDPHDNPSISIDGDGHIWVFVSGRGRIRPGFRYRSVEPFSTEAFERIDETEMTYPQPWRNDDGGFLLLFTKYTGVRELYWSTSSDGKSWTRDRKLAGMGGHYQTSCRVGKRVLTAFNMHPLGNVDVRTNLYFAETDDNGENWYAADGTLLEPPLTDVHTPALVRDFMIERRLVYMKDMTVDNAGNPVILVVTSAHHRPGPGGDPRIWTIAHRHDDRWHFHEITRSTHNYDMGSLIIEPDGDWLLIAPTESGPQSWGTGGEMALWRSTDEGVSWSREQSITTKSDRNHSYARRPRRVDGGPPHPDFYAFWADGNPDELSQSRLYFTDRTGTVVRRLPASMTGDTAEPEVL